MNKKSVVIVLVLLAVSFGAGYFATPTKVKTEIKEVVKTVTEEQKTKVVYKEKIIYADGTIVEREKEYEEWKKKEDSESSKESSKVVTKDTGLTLSALAIVDIKDIGGEREYAVTVSKRVFGAVNVTAIVTTDKRLGIGLGWSF